MIAAIYNIFDSEELLEGSIKQIRETVDIVIAVVSYTSNNHEHKYTGGRDEVKRLAKMGLIDHIVEFQPLKGYFPMFNERLKRNEGLKYAIKKGADYFISMDCDEYYEPDKFAHAYNEIKRLDYDSTVVRMHTYFGEPTLKLEQEEGYFVPFICKTKIKKSDVVVGNYDCGFYCDPTRKPNNRSKDISRLIKMYHFSWVRKDRDSYERKMQYSSAASNIRRIKSSIYDDLANAAPDRYVAMYKQKLTFTDNLFNISL